MLCTSSDPIMPYLFAFQCIGGIILFGILLVLYGHTQSKNEFPPAVRTVSLATLLVVIVGAVVLTSAFAGDPCPQPTPTNQPAPCVSASMRPCPPAGLPNGTSRFPGPHTTSDDSHPPPVEPRRSLRSTKIAPSNPNRVATPSTPSVPSYSQTIRARTFTGTRF